MLLHADPVPLARQGAIVGVCFESGGWISVLRVCVRVRQRGPRPLLGRVG